MSDMVWKPKHPERSQMWQFLQSVNQRHHLSLNTYEALHQWSIDYPELFWLEVADFYNVHFKQQPVGWALAQHPCFIDTEWFKGAALNFAEHLLRGTPGHIAIKSFTEHQPLRTITYQALRKLVGQFANGLKDLGVGVGDRVAAIMPNIPETIIAMLATTSIGAIWSSCSPDFGETAIIDRLGQIEPKVLILTDGHQYQGKPHSSLDKIPGLQKAMKSLKKIIIFKHLGIDLPKSLTPLCTTWDDFIVDKPDNLSFEILPFNHPIYILYSSGTTGKPKCIVHGAGGTLLQHLKELGLHTDIRSKDSHLFYTTCGWMMWNWMASTLALGATVCLYEGSPTYPDTTHLFQIIDANDISVFGTSAKFLSSIMHEGVKPNQFKLQALRTILSTGSPLLPEHYDYVYRDIKPDIQLSSISGGSDIISCFALGNPLLPVYRGELQCLGLGMAVNVFDEQGKPIKEKRGELVCTQPFPSMPVGFWHDEGKTRYHKAYFERFDNVWAHGDFAEITNHQGLIIYGRSDATLNPGGVRIGTAEIYRIIETISEITDSVVIGQEWQDDVRIVLFVKLKPELTLDETLINTIKTRLKTQASPRHVPAKILQVNDIPRTLSGKIVELAVKEVVHNHPVTNLSSLANPEALAQYKDRKELT